MPIFFNFRHLRVYYKHIRERPMLSTYEDFLQILKEKKTVDMCNDFGVLCNLTYISTYVRICFTDHISHTVAAAHNPFFIGVFLRTSVNLGRSFQMQYLAC